MRHIHEAKTTIEDEYKKDWAQNIPWEEFQQIIALDPRTNIENNFIGPSAKQFLLPRRLEGEDFLDKADQIKDCLTTYMANRGNYPKELRNIAMFPSVKDFIEYIQLGDESDFAKNFDLTGSEEIKPAESKLDTIYNKYYSKLDRRLFDTIISLDPQTTDDSIGSIAKNLLLPKALSGEEFLKEFTESQIKDVIKFFLEEGSTLPEDRRQVEKYASVKDFVEYCQHGPQSEMMERILAWPDIGQKLEILPSTRNFDIFHPLTHEGNYAVTSLGNQGNKHHFTWCTGWYNDNRYWNNYSKSKYIYCFVYKKNLNDKTLSYQVAISKTNFEVTDFFNGEDISQYPYPEKFEEFLFKYPEVYEVLTKQPFIKDCPSVKKVGSKLKYHSAPFIADGQAAVLEYVNNGLKSMVKQLIIKMDTVPAGAFAGSVALEKVTFETDVKKIGVQAFMGCSFLNKIELPSGLTEIGAEAFAFCTMLKGTIRIPDSVVKIGRRAFAGDAVKLSINAKRGTPLSIPQEDVDWYVRHAKVIQIQEDLNDLNEDLITENIPPDLARAYRNSAKATRGILGNPESEHGELANSNAALRRRIKYDYANSNYREISKEEARNLIARDRNQLQNLRFIVDGKLIEYEVRSGNRLYQTYYINIPEYKMQGQNPIMGKDGRPTFDSRFAIRYGDLQTIINISDKIYLTDEYEHLITDETPGRHRTRVQRTDSEGNPLFDENGNPIYDIVNEPIKSRRQTRNDWLTSRTILPNYTPATGVERDQHRPGQHYGRQIAIADPAALDTGAHEMRLALRGSQAYGYNYTLERLGQTHDLVTTLWKRFDYIRKAIKKLESERDLYDDQEYENKLDSLKKQQQKEYNAYLSTLNEYKNLRSSLINSFDEDVLELHLKTKETLSRWERLGTEVYNLKRQIEAEDIKSIDSYGDMPRLKRQCDSLLREIDSAKKSREDLLQQLDELRRKISDSEVTIEEAGTRLTDLMKEFESGAEEAINIKLQTIQTLKQAYERKKAEYDQIRNANRSVKAKPEQPVKTLSPELANVLSIESSEQE